MNTNKHKSQPDLPFVVHFPSVQQHMLAQFEKYEGQLDQSENIIDVSGKVKVTSDTRPFSKLTLANPKSTSQNAIISIPISQHSIFHSRH